MGGPFWGGQIGGVRGGPGRLALPETVRHARPILGFAATILGFVRGARGQALPARLTAGVGAAVSWRFPGRFDLASPGTPFLVVGGHSVHGSGDARRRRVGIDGALGHSRFGGTRIELQPRRGITAVDALDAAVGVLEAIARLTVAVPLLPGFPARFAVGRRDGWIEVEPIAMLEANAAFMEHLHARSTAHDERRDQKSERCPRRGASAREPLVRHTVIQTAAPHTAPQEPERAAARGGVIIRACVI